MKGKRFLSLLLSLLMLMSCVAGVDFSAYALSSSGSCGTKVTYTFDSSTGELVISGTGAMTDYYFEIDYPDSPFYNQSGIKTVVINSGVTSIGDYAFYYCTGLTSVTIPDSVTSIGSHAFENCTGLTSVTIPNSVTIIDSFAFYNVNNIVYHGSVTGTPWGAKAVNGYVDGYFVYKDSSKQELLGCSSTATGDITIPDSVTSIGYEAFSGCTGLTSVTIPNTVTSIGSGAFGECTGLTSVTIPNSVTYISSYAFGGCTGLTSVIIPDSVTSIGEYAFFGCTGLTSVTIPDSVTSIGFVAFCECTGLTSVTIGDSVTSIVDWAFYDCTGLTSVTIPDSVTSIGERAFYNCTGLTSVTIPDSVTSIGYGAFYNVNNIVYHGSATGTPWGAKAVNGYVDGYFVYKDSSKQELLGCSSAATGDITIPDSVTSIGFCAFGECTGLTSVTIPDSVTSIGHGAFEYCTGIKELTMPASAKIYNSEYAFYNCSNIEKVTLTKGTGTMQSYGINSSSSSYTYYRYTPWYISRNRIKEIVIEDGVKNISSYAFYDCTGLTNVTIGNSVTSIGYKAFRGCTGLTSVTIGDSVTSIGEEAFNGCTSLTSVTIPDSVTSIGEEAFYGCSNLNNIYYIGTQSQWNNISKGSDSIPSSAKIIYHTSCTYDLVEALEPTCFEEGYNLYRCRICNKEYKEILAKHTAGDTVIENRVEPTCTIDGSYDEVVYCTVCNEELNREANVIRSAHMYKVDEYIEPDCENDGLTILVCSACGDIIFEEPKALGHAVVVENSVPATCTEAGLTEGSHCSRCSKVIVRQEVIPALNHNYVLADWQSATCTVDGYEVYACQNCGDSYDLVLPATGHNNELYRTTVTCEKAGYNIYKCSVCSATTTVKADALGGRHNYGEFVGAENGIMTYSCSTCNNEYTVESGVVSEMWDLDLINKSADECPALDIVSDGIINAKDYAMLRHIARFGC